MGGSIAKYVKDGERVIKIVFSHGEKSIPHLRESVVKRARYEETDIASNFIGIKISKNLGLKDTKLKSEIERPAVTEKIRQMILMYRPDKIYVPSALDPHPDHQAVNSIVLSIVKSLRRHYPVYAFEVWNVVKETHPRVYIDISPYIDVKMEYIKLFKSQWLYMFSLYLPALFRSFYYGRKNNCKYAERFYKLL